MNHFSKSNKLIKIIPFSDNIYDLYLSSKLIKSEGVTPIESSILGCKTIMISQQDHKYFLKIIKKYFLIS